MVMVFSLFEEELPQPVRVRASTAPKTATATAKKTFFALEIDPSFTFFPFHVVVNVYESKIVRELSYARVWEKW